MQSTVDCGWDAAAGSSFGHIGTLCGLIIGGLISFFVDKCARKVDRKYDNVWFNDVAGESKKVPTKTVEDIIGECEPFAHKRSLKQYIKEGGYEEALKDFESLFPKDVKEIKTGNTGKVGYLDDGRTVNVRIKSSGNLPTLEIYNPIDETSIKIRYEKKD